ncbi:hypothetical protein BDV28DRAFT_133229 [Aspergillus coremiiformis]|uniref:NmrA-like domain-containing protein n=1 Tax=Aspergillus coremiiformis TaxID=138285 RepID=A0A5N6Z942_9EURO|nr:hypothetical protein BDV28DRAFT_133229 [Aspergillus coremiiformis]
MRVIIAGNGDMARYICEEFTSAGHELVILTRSHKPDREWPGVTQFITDYTLPSLATALQDGEVLISTIGDMTQSYVEVSRNLIQACQQSPTCKRFIPSEFVGDIETYPDQPGFYIRSREPIRKLLREQTDLEWTLVSVGWLCDYMVPVKNRYVKDVDPLCPLSLANGTMVIPGTGNEPVDFVWMRDIVKALAKLVIAPVWEPYTLISAERSNWNTVARVIRDKYRPDLKIQHISLGQIVETIRTSNDQDIVDVAQHQLLSACHACSLPPDQVQAHKEKYFPGIRFRTLQDGLDEFDRDAATIV